VSNVELAVGSAIAKARTEGKLFELKPGDKVKLAGTVYKVTVDNRGYVHLTRNSKGA